MKYLFIVTESLSANGVCTKAVMERLAKDHRVFCITNREYGGPLQYEQHGVSYYTVKPRLVYRLESRVAHDAPGKRWIARAIPLINKPKLLLTVGSWPLISPAYARRIGRLAKKLCRREGVGCIVPVYTQIDTLVAACRVKRAIPGVRYVPYFLDSLSGGYGPRWFTAQQTRRHGLRWERRLLPSADAIVCMSSSRTHHEKYSADAPYYHKIRYFDLPLFRIEPVEPGDPLMDHTKRNLVYVGTLPGGIRSPRYVLEMFRQLEGDGWQLYFIGSSSCPELDAVTDPRIHVVGRVDHDLALRYEAQADILINIGNTNPNMTPSKIFEYMSFGKPIVSTMAVEQEPSRAYLERYSMALLLDERKDTPKSAAAQLTKFAATVRPVDQAQVFETFYPNTPAAFVEFLKEMENEL